MPTISVDPEYLWKLMECEPKTQTEFEDLCFEYGIELDDVEYENEEKKTGVTYKIDVPANRADLCCAEGIAQALKVFESKTGTVGYNWIKYLKKEPTYTIHVDQTVADHKIRPFIVGAVLRDVQFDEERYQSFIDFQDKLHHNICRRRRLVAIGTHDISKITGTDIKYSHDLRKDCKFVPLNQTEEMDGDRIIEFYTQVRTLAPYLPLLEPHQRFPIIRDAEKVLSLPPLINGDASKMSAETRDVFIEMTATDETRAHTVLATILTAFSMHCTAPFHVEPVRVVYPDGKEVLTPELDPMHMLVPRGYIRRMIGTDLEEADVTEYLRRMGLKVLPNTFCEESFMAEIPVHRADIMHPCDIAEDVAIAYGFDNVREILPPVSRAGGILPISDISDDVRHLLAGAGCIETVQFALMSRPNARLAMWEKMEKDAWPVTVYNAKSRDYAAVRTSLTAGLLLCAANNNNEIHPLKIFEVGPVLSCPYGPGSKDVELPDNDHRVAVLMADKVAMFSEIHGIVDKLVGHLGVEDKLHIVEGTDVPTFDVKKNSLNLDQEDEEEEEESAEDATTDVERVNVPVFLPGRYGHVMMGDRVVGSFGTIHPVILRDFHIKFPCAVCELSLSTIFEHLKRDF